LDQRGQLINQLAGDINVQVLPGNLNQVNVLAGDAPLVVSDQSESLQYSLASGDQGQVKVAGSSTPLTVTGGQAGGMLAVRNQSLANVQTQLVTLADAVAQQVDEVQATGLGLSGPSAILSGRAVSATSMHRWTRQDWPSHRKQGRYTSASPTCSPAHAR
jgi:flagellar hook-associated protein FlgK